MQEVRWTPPPKFLQHFNHGCISGSESTAAYCPLQTGHQNRLSPADSGADIGHDGDLSAVPDILWDAGFRHPDGVSSSMTINVLATLVHQPLPVASRILTMCGKYSSE